jgi:transposase, IS5 family
MRNNDSNQINIYGDLLETLVPMNHAYRKVLEIVDFGSVCIPLRSKYVKDDSQGYSIEIALKCIILQQWEDMSDRQMERFLQENNAAKYFCGFNLLDKTPDHSFFGRVRDRISVEKIVELMNNVTSQLKAQKIASEVFTFIDSTAVISKLSLWKERDKILQENIPARLKAIEKNIPAIDVMGNIKECVNKEDIKTTNKNISKYAEDPDAKIGRKGAKKYWYGYKRHVAVDGKSGIITKVEVTSANILDHDSGVFEKLLPDSGMVLADRGYDTNEVEEIMFENKLHSGVRKRKVRKNLDRDYERWKSAIRSPFEGVFRYADKTTVYIGLHKVKFHQVLDSLVFNLKRLIVINKTPVFGVIKIS